MKSLLKRAIWLCLIILIAAGGYVAYERWIKKQPIPEGLIQANGRIEGDHVTIAGKFAGRIKKLIVREGDAVKEGQVLEVELPQQLACVTKRSRTQRFNILRVRTYLPYKISLPECYFSSWKKGDLPRLSLA